MTDPTRAYLAKFRLQESDEERKQREYLERFGLGQQTEPEDRKGVLGTASDFARGAATGVVNAVPAAVDFAMMIADVPLPGQPFKNTGVREGLHRTMGSVREAFDPRGTAGKIGEFAGSIAGGAVIPGAVNPYSLVARSTARAAQVMARTQGATTGIKGLINAAAATTGKEAAKYTLAQRIGGSVLGGAPVNVAQATLDPLMPEDQRLESLAIGTAIDAALPGVQKLLFDKRPRLSQFDEPKAHEVPVIPPERIVRQNAAIDAVRARSEAALRKNTAISVWKKSAATKTELRDTYRKDWEARNPDQDYTEWRASTRPKDFKILYDNWLRENFERLEPRMTELVQTAEAEKAGRKKQPKHAFGKTEGQALFEAALLPRPEKKPEGAFVTYLRSQWHEGKLTGDPDELDTHWKEFSAKYTETGGQVLNDAGLDFVTGYKAPARGEDMIPVPVSTKHPASIAAVLNVLSEQPEAQPTLFAVKNDPAAKKSYVDALRAEVEKLKSGRDEVSGVALVNPTDARKLDKLVSDTEKLFGLKVQAPVKPSKKAAPPVAVMPTDLDGYMKWLVDHARLRPDFGQDADFANMGAWTINAANAYRKMGSQAFDPRAPFGSRLMRIEQKLGVSRPGAFTEAPVVPEVAPVQPKAAPGPKLPKAMLANEPGTQMIQHQNKIYVRTFDNSKQPVPMPDGQDYWAFDDMEQATDALQALRVQSGQTTLAQLNAKYSTAAQISQLGPKTREALRARLKEIIDAEGEDSSFGRVYRLLGDVKVEESLEPPAKEPIPPQPLGSQWGKNPAYDPVLTRHRVTTGDKSFVVIYNTETTPNARTQRMFSETVGRAPEVYGLIGAAKDVFSVLQGDPTLGGHYATPEGQHPVRRNQQPGVPWQDEIMFGGIIADELYGLYLPKQHSAFINPFQLAAHYPDQIQFRKEILSTIVHEFFHGSGWYDGDPEYGYILTNLLGRHEVMARIEEILTPSVDAFYHAYHSRYHAEWSKFASPNARTDVAGVARSNDAPVPRMADRPSVRAGKGLEHIAEADAREARGPADPKRWEINWPHTLKGGAVGFFTGIGNIEEDDTRQEALAKVFSWTLAGAVGGEALYRIRAGAKLRQQDSPLSGTIQNVERLKGGSQVVRYEDAETKVPLPVLTKLRGVYRSIARSVYGLEEIEKVTRPLVGGYVDPDVLPSRRVGLAGRWMRMTEHWFDQRPLWEDEHGMPVELETQSLSFGDILKMADYDVDGLGHVLAAKSSIDVLSNTPRRKTPFTLDEADMIIRDAEQKAPHLIAASEEFRKYMLALAEVGLKTGKITRPVFEDWKQREWYAPLEHILPPEERLVRPKFGKEVTNEPRAFYGAKSGSTSPIRNPVEVAMLATARVLHSAEYGSLVNSLVDYLEMIPEKDLREQYLRPSQNRANGAFAKVQSSLEELRQQGDLTTKEAAALQAFATDGPTLVQRGPNDTRYILSTYRDGEFKTYEVTKGAYETFASLSQKQSDLVKALAGMTRFAQKGIVYHPNFIFTQAIVDTFHSWFTSRYGFRPVIDSWRGFKAVATNEPAYQRLEALGGPSAIQTLPYIGKPKDVLPRIGASAGGQTPAQQAWKLARELRPIEAYKALSKPIAEAARVGEYLRALDHGATPIEAVYAAWNVQGNVRMQGSLAAMQAVNQISLFTRAGISGLDESIAQAGLHPFRAPERFGQEVPRAQAVGSTLMKGLGLSAASALLWAVNKDDEEITQMRKTEAGTRYWFLRSADGQVMRIRKPHVYGQVFGTQMEQILDRMLLDDPQGTDSWSRALVEDAAVNFLPQIGVVTAGLWSGKVPGLGTSLVSDTPLDPALMGSDQASEASKTLSRIVAPAAQKLLGDELGMLPDWVARTVSPAGFDYIARNLGMATEDVIGLVSTAMLWSKEGMAPPADEWPGLRRVIRHTPTRNAASLRLFYERAEAVDVVANTSAELLSKGRMDEWVDYFMANYRIMMNADGWRETRGQLLELTRALEAVEAIPGMSAESKRRYRDTFTEIMTTQAKVRNMTWIDKESGQ